MLLNTLLSSEKVNAYLYQWGDNTYGQLGLNGQPIYHRWQELSSSENHTLGIRADGTLWAWGLNTSGELGDGTTVAKSSPVQIGLGLMSWSMVSAGTGFSLAMDTTGKIWSWGNNNVGQLGNTTTINRSAPTILSRNSWSFIGVGNSNAVAIRKDNAAFVWGNNTSGGLGLNDIINRSTPTQLPGSWSVTSLAAGIRMGGSGVQTNGSLWTWGTNNFGEMGTGDTVSTSSPVKIGTESWSYVASGFDHTVAVRSNGTLFAWGNNANGELGTNEPVTVAYSSPVQVGTNSWISVSAGDGVTGGVDYRNNAFTWGYNVNGQLGDTTTIDRSQPVLIDGNSRTKFIDVVGARTGAGSITFNNLYSFMFGDNDKGQLGQNDTVNRSLPVQVNLRSTTLDIPQVTSNSDWKQVAISDHHSVGIKDDGTLWVWGRNDSGQLGLGPEEMYTSRSSPVQLGTDTWSYVAVWPKGTLAIKSDGTMWGWGDNSGAFLGNVPLVVDGLTPSVPYATGRSNWTQVYTGPTTFGLRRDGTLWAWGLSTPNTTNIPDGITVNRSLPVLVSNRKWKKINYIDGNVVGIRDDNSVFAWGSYSNNTFPVPLYNATNPAALTSMLPVVAEAEWQDMILTTWSAGGLKVNGTIWTWTGNNSGATASIAGQNSTIARSSPTQLGAASNWTQYMFSSGSTGHSIAINSSNQLWIWGNGASGQLGTATTITRSSPVQVAGTWSTAVTASGATAAIDTLGQLFVWGANTSGRFGLNDTINRSSPVQVMAGRSFKSVDISGNALWAVSTDGTLWASGVQTQRQMLAGDTITRSSPIQVGADSDWDRVVPNSTASGTPVAFKTNGDVYVWGQNTNGQLGTGSLVTRSVLTAIPSYEYASPVQVNTKIWKTLSIGVDHVIAIDSTDAMWGWGKTDSSQLGFNASDLRSSPVQIGAGQSWIAIAAGNKYSLSIDSNYQIYSWGSSSIGTYVTGMYNTVPQSWSQINTNPNFGTVYAVKTNGTLWSWGSNNAGQLGVSDVISRSSPVQIGSSSGWRLLATNGRTATEANAMAVLDTTVYGWGYNASYQVASASTGSQSSPVLIATNFGISDTAALGSNNGIISRSGAMLLGGSNTYWGLLNGSSNLSSAYVSHPVAANLAQVYVAGSALAALTTSGALYTWGDNSLGQRGINTTAATADARFYGYATQVKPKTSFTKVWANDGNYFHALDSTGSLWFWGSNTSAAAGSLPDVSIIRSPILVGGLDDKWTDLIPNVTGAGRIFGKKQDGSWWQWGYAGGLTQLSASFTQVAVGDSSSFAIRSDKRLIAWGNNAAPYNLGDGTSVTRSNPVSIYSTRFYDAKDPYNTKVETQFFKDVASAGARTFGIKHDGTLWVWGNSGTNIIDGIMTGLGFRTGTLANLSTPTQINAGNSWAQVAADASSAYAIDTAGDLYAWGNNGTVPGRLGIPNTTHSWKQASAHATNTYLIRSDGALFAVGSPYNAGQIPIGYNPATAALTDVNSSSPVQIGTSSWASVSAGLSHGLAITGDGRLFAWGDNTYGQLGDNTIYSRSSPVQIGTSSWSFVRAGSRISFGIKIDGTLWAWGLNQNGLYGQLTTYANYSSPIQIGTGSTWSKLTITPTVDQTVLAIKSDNTLWGWGINDVGQLGSAPRANRISWVVGPTPQITTNQLSGMDSESNIWIGGSNPYVLSTGPTLNYSRKAPERYSAPVAISQYIPGYDRQFIIDDIGRLWGWGLNQFGQVGVGSDVKWSKIMNYNWGNGGWGGAISTTGELYVWNVFGDGPYNTGTSTTFPTQIGADSNWADVAAYNSGGVATKTNGSIWLWGQSTMDLVRRSSPTFLGSLTNNLDPELKFKGAAPSMGMTGNAYGPNGFSFIDEDDNLHLYYLQTSSSNYGNLGIGLPAVTTSGRSLPVLVGGVGRKFTTTAMGVSNAAIEKDTNNLFVWGANSGVALGGALGLGDAQDRSYPAQVVGKQASKIMGVWGSTLYYTDTTGKLWVSGNNASGVLGDGTTINRSSPVQIGSGSWSWLSGGDASGNLRFGMMDNTLYAWGAIAYAPTVSNITAVDTGGYSYIGVTADNNAILGILNDGTAVGIGGTGLGGTNYAAGAGYFAGTAVPRTFTFASPATMVMRAVPFRYTLPTIRRPALISSASWTSVNAMGATTFGIQTDGSLWVWGNNQNGQAGVGTNGPILEVTKIGNNSWTMATSSQIHSLGIRADGTLWTWGQNANGQLGLGDTIQRSSPVQVGTSTWTSVFAGNFRSYAIRSDGTVWAWGFNSGALGDSTTIQRSSPVQVGTLTGITDIGAYASDAAFAIDNTGQTYMWGSNNSGLLTTSRSTPVSIAAVGTSPKIVSRSNFTNGTGLSSLLYINSSGDVYGSGPSEGDLTLGTNVLVPRLTYKMMNQSPVQIGTDTWREITLGLGHAAGINTDYKLFTWGQNTFGQLGLGDRVTRSAPTQVDTSSWIAVSATSSGTVAVQSGKTVWGTGFNYNSEIGLGLTNTIWSWTMIGGGNQHTAAIRSDGTLWTWGQNNFGELGLGSTGGVLYSPNQVGTATDWSKVAVGQNFTAGLKTDGTLWTWGLNTSGQLGLGDAVLRNSPVQVPGSWTNISAGTFATMALKAGNIMFTWGANNSGRLGLGDTIARSSPVQVAGTWVTGDIGANGGLAINNLGQVFCWGDGSSGAIGNSTTISRSAPTQITSTSSFTFVSAAKTVTSNQFNFGITTVGSLFAWGSGSSGNLGTGTTINRSVPVQITTPVASWTSIGTHGWAQAFNSSSTGAGAQALTTAGTLYTWGVQVYGLNFGTTLYRSTPQQIGTAGEWKTNGLMSGSAIKTNNTLYTWGTNYWGNLGLSDTVNQVRSSPSLVGGQLITEYTQFTQLFDGLGAYNAENVVTGSNYGFALSATPLTRYWGINSAGQLGDSTTLNRVNTTLTSTTVEYPMPTKIGSDFAKVSVGLESTMALKTDGSLWTWGSNSFGQLMLGDTVRRSSPTQVGTSSWTQISMSSGSSYGMAITSNGDLFAAGADQNLGVMGQGTAGATFYSAPTQIPGTWQSIATASSSAYGVKTNNTLWAWGLNSSGQLGTLDTINRSSPVQVGTATNWSRVFARGTRALATSTTGSLWSWGANTIGQLGDGTSIARSAPVQITSNALVYPEPVPYTMLFNSPTTIANTHGTGLLAIDPSTSYIYGFGNNTQGQLGLNNIASRSVPTILGNYLAAAPSTPTPMFMGGVSASFTQISAGYRHAAAVATDNKIYTWGYGVGSMPVDPRTTWIDGGLRGFGATNSMFGIRSDRTLWVWGANGNGQLGQDNVGIYNTQRQVPGSWLVVSTWPTSYYGIRMDGTLWSWGNNASGQLGLGDVVNRSSPVQVGTSSWVTVSAGNAFAVGMTVTGEVYAWGLNTAGQLGINTTTNRSQPVLVDGSWSSVSAGTSYMAALTTGNQWWSWGGNSNGELGIGLTTSRSSPVQVAAQSTQAWHKLYAGDRTVTGIRSDGTLWVVGSNSGGMAGDNTTISRSTPVQIAGSWVDSINNGLLTYAQRPDGTLFGWGTGQYFTGPMNTTVVRSSPVQLGTRGTWYYPGNVRNLYPFNGGKLLATGTTNQLITPWGEMATFGTAQAGNEMGDGAVAGTARSSPVFLNSTPGTPNQVYNSVPVQVSTSLSWVAVSAGYDNTFGIANIGGNRTVYAWGRNEIGQLGLGTTTPMVTSPTQLDSLTKNDVSDENDYSDALYNKITDLANSPNVSVNGGYIKKV